MARHGTWCRVRYFSQEKVQQVVLTSQGRMVDRTRVRHIPVKFNSNSNSTLFRHGKTSDLKSVFHATVFQ